MTDMKMNDKDEMNVDRKRARVCRPNGAILPFFVFKIVFVFSFLYF